MADDYRSRFHPSELQANGIPVFDALLDLQEKYGGLSYSFGARVTVPQVKEANDIYFYMTGQKEYQMKHRLEEFILKMIQH